MSTSAATALSALLDMLYVPNCAKMTHQSRVNMIKEMQASHPNVQIAEMITQLQTKVANQIMEDVKAFQEDKPQRFEMFRIQLFNYGYFTSQVPPTERHANVKTAMDAIGVADVIKDLVTLLGYWVAHNTTSEAKMHIANIKADIEYVIEHLINEIHSILDVSNASGYDITVSTNYRQTALFKAVTAEGTKLMEKNLTNIAEHVRWIVKCKDILKNDASTWRDIAENIAQDLLLINSWMTSLDMLKTVVQTPKPATVSLREYDYGMGEDAHFREVALSAAIDAVGEERVMMRLNQLHDMWRDRKVQNAKMYTKNIEADKCFVKKYCGDVHSALPTYHHDLKFDNATKRQQDLMEAIDRTNAQNVKHYLNVKHKLYKASSTFKEYASRIVDDIDFVHCECDGDCDGSV